MKSETANATETVSEAVSEAVSETVSEAVEHVEDFSRKSVDQAEAAFEKAAEAAHGNVQVLDASAGAFKTRGADLQMKVMEITQANMTAAFSYLREALAVKSPTDLFRLNQDFGRARLEAFQAQAQELNQLTVALTKETVKPVQESLLKSISSLAKAA